MQQQPYDNESQLHQKSLLLAVLHWESKSMLSSCLPFNNIKQQMFIENLPCVMNLHIISLHTYSNLVRFSAEEAKD